MKIELAAVPDEGELKVLSEGIKSFNEEHMPGNLVHER